MADVVNPLPAATWSAQRRTAGPSTSTDLPRRRLIGAVAGGLIGLYAAHSAYWAVHLPVVIRRRAG